MNEIVNKSLSLAELKKIQEESSKLIEELESEKRNTGLAQISEICEKFQISLKDLKLFVRNYGKTTTSPATVIKTYVSSSGEKFVDDGVAKKPKFIRDWLKAGKDISELELKTEEQSA